MSIKRPRHNLHSVKPVEETSAIELKDVKFRYTASGPVVLDIPDLVIRRGEKVSIVGPSGAGKTTLFRMVKRIYSA